MNERSAYSRPESVLVVIATRNDRFLLLERRRPAAHWQSVTGALKPNEQPYDAACREVFEETGFQTDAVRATGVVNRYPIPPEWRERYARDVSENTEHVFLLVVDKPFEVTHCDDEHANHGWYDRAVAIDRVFSYTNRAAIEALNVNEF